MFRLFIIPLFVLIPAFAHTESRIAIIRGPILLGTETSGIDGLTPDGDFVNGTDVYRDILASCDVLKECEVTGVVDSDGWIQSVVSARTIDTNSEPSNDVIKEAACWALALSKPLKKKHLTIKSLEMHNYRSELVHGRTIWSFDYEMTVEERGKPSHRLGPGSVKLVKQGESWHYFR